MFEVIAEALWLIRSTAVPEKEADSKLLAPLSTERYSSSNFFVPYVRAAL